MGAVRGMLGDDQLPPIRADDGSYCNDSSLALQGFHLFILPPFRGVGLLRVCLVDNGFQETRVGVGTIGSGVHAPALFSCSGSEGFGQEGIPRAHGVPDGVCRAGKVTFRREPQTNPPYFTLIDDL